MKKKSKRATREKIKCLVLETEAKVRAEVQKRIKNFISERVQEAQIIKNKIGRSREALRRRLATLESGTEVEALSKRARDLRKSAHLKLSKMKESHREIMRNSDVECERLRQDVSAKIEDLEEMCEKMVRRTSSVDDLLACLRRHFNDDGDPETSGSTRIAAYG